MTAYPGLAQNALQLYPYGNSGRQRVNRQRQHFVTILPSVVSYNRDMVRTDKNEAITVHCQMIK